MESTDRDSSRANPNRGRRKTVVMVGVYEARTRFSELLDRVAKGERIVITRHGTPVAALEPVDQPNRLQVKEAIERLKELRKGKSLGGLTFRDLIEEGRRF